MWGQEIAIPVRADKTGIIPTRVGTSVSQPQGRYSTGDHPHACGDKCGYLIPINSAEGSSPRVWGQGYKKDCYQSECRIIPTRVGTSCVLHLRYAYSEDHPHACGDKCESGMHVCKNPGSSPRVWGQATHFSVSGVNLGIIPTRVGTSYLFCDYNTNLWDHPHACGDKTKLSYSFHT